MTAPCWFETIGGASNGVLRNTVWYWDGRRGWHTDRRLKSLKPSQFTVANMLRCGFRIIPDPFVPDELRLPEGI